MKVLDLDSMPIYTNRTDDEILQELHATDFVQHAIQPFTDDLNAHLPTTPKTPTT